uniref:Leucine rich immune protein (Coil-less) n=1 Tax=Anopheles melas TaxID=34690 RepID=A0A1I8JV48_9DIPT
MRFKHLDTLTFDHSIAKHLVETVEELEIVDSRALIHFILPSASAIQRLTIARTQLNWIHFQPNEAVLLVSIVSSNLQLVPPSLRNLNNVKYIKLQKSYIRYLNLDLLQWLRKLDTLDLMYNKIHTLASTFQCLQQHNLVTLNLRNNQLRILNLELLPLIGLFEQVDLSHNKIELLVGRFSSDHLQTLIVSHNRLKVIDFCQWDSMPTLAKMSFEANELTRVPYCIHHLPNLTYVGFGSNKFTQVDMERFGELENLTTLNFSANRISLITFREENYPVRLSKLILSNNQAECDLSFGVTFCPLDIEFKSNVSYRTGWMNNNSTFHRQLVIVK